MPVRHRYANPVHLDCRPLDFSFLVYHPAPYTHCTVMGPRLIDAAGYGLQAVFYAPDPVHQRQW